jgi:hypothetical protein
VVDFYTFAFSCFNFVVLLSVLPHLITDYIAFNRVKDAEANKEVAMRPLVSRVRL